MPTTAATLTLNVPAITGLLAIPTANAIVTQLSTFQLVQGQTAVSNLTANSGNWQASYTTVFGNSANWNTGIANNTTFLINNSAAYNNTTTTLSTNSGSWQSTYSTLCASSGYWQAFYTAAVGSSALWSQGANATTTLANNSASWNSVDSVVVSQSAGWTSYTIAGVTVRGPYSLIGNGSVFPVSGSPTYGSVTNWNVQLGGNNTTNSGNYNAIVGGNRTFISGGNYNFIGTGNLNHIGGTAITTTTSGVGVASYISTLPINVLSGNGSACVRILDTQGGNFSNNYNVNDIITIGYSTNSTAVTAISTFTTAKVASVCVPTTSNVGSIIVNTTTITPLTAAAILAMYNQCNTTNSCGGSIVGGSLNTASGNYSTVGGGFCNFSLSGGTIVGGIQNYASTCSYIGGGCGNNAITTNSVIAGGSFNKTGNICALCTQTLSTNPARSLTQIQFPLNCGILMNVGDPISVAWNTTGQSGPALATLSQATIYCKNFDNVSFGVAGAFGPASAPGVCGWVIDRVAATGCFNTIGGGAYNTASGCYSVVAGGLGNTACSDSSIGGGQCNISNGCWSVIGGGCRNDIETNYSTVAGGTQNCILGFNAFIGGGQGNCIAVTGGYSIIGGGVRHTNSGVYGVVAGGYQNNNSGWASFIAAGSGNCVAVNVFNSSILGTNICATQSNTTYVNNISSQCNIYATGNIYACGNVYGGMGLSIISGTTYTFQLSDNGNMIGSTNSQAGLSACFSPNINYPVGFQTAVTQLSTARVTLSSAPTNPFNQSNGYCRTRVQYSSTTIMYTGTPAGWIVFGDVAS